MQNFTLKDILPSSKPTKKFDAIFIYKNKDGEKKEKVVSFGAAGYQDYTQHKDKQRRELYRIRHKNDNLTDPTSPGALSWFILWNKPSIKENIKSFRQLFNV